MKVQMKWNILAAVAIIFLVLGYFVERSNANIEGKILIILGGIVFIVSVVGSGIVYKKIPSKCPVCGSEIKPVGRWLPGIGFNGTNIITCPHCGAIVPIQDLEQE